LSQTLDQRVPAFGRLLVGENVRVHERPVSWYTTLKTRRVGTTLVGVTCTALGYHRPRYPNSTVCLDTVLAPGGLRPTWTRDFRKPICQNFVTRHGYSVWISIFLCSSMLMGPLPEEVLAATNQSRSLGLQGAPFRSTYVPDPSPDA
jgi:hypothetical protein